MKDLINPWPQPRLLLLDLEVCDYPAIVITAYQVLDGAGNRVTGCNSKAEASAIRDRYAAKYPEKKFYAQ